MKEELIEKADSIQNAFPTSENKRTEFKEIVTDDLEKEVVAFLNSDGGDIYIGVNSRGEITGTAETDLLQRRITDRIKNNILPETLGLFEIETEKHQNKTILRITLSKGNEKPYYIAKYGMSPKGCFLRVGSSTRQMTTDLINTTLRKRTHPQLSQILSPTQNLTFTQLQIYYSSRGYTIPPLFLENLGLKTDDGKYTYAAYLLADKNDITMRVAGYAGTDKLNLISNDEYGYTSIITAAQKILEKLDIINTNRAAVEGIQRTEKRLIDANALREAVINAIVHNDYTHGLSPVIEIYADRIEITSAGGLPAELSEEEFYLGYSAPRNRTLMRIFRDLGYVEHLGNGLRKILSRYDKTVFAITPHFLKVIFRFENEDTIDSTCLVGEKAYLNGDGACLKGESASLNGDKAYFEGDSASLNGDKAYFERGGASLNRDKAYFEGDGASLNGDKAYFTADEAYSDRDKACFVTSEETAEFEKLLAEKIGTALHSKTKETLISLFKTTGYLTILRKKDILTAFNIKERQAGALLKKLVEHTILKRIRRDTYVFISPETTQTNPAEPKEKEP